MRSLKHAVFVSFGLLALVAGAVAHAQDSPAAEAAFQPTTTDWAAAYNAGDADSIVALYTEDAVVMPPDVPAVSGHAALRVYLVENMAKASDAGITLAIAAGDAGSSGDLGWRTGTYTVSADGNTVGTGKYLELWQRQHGQWRMIRDIWNNDAPAATASEE